MNRNWSDQKQHSMQYQTWPFAVFPVAGSVGLFGKWLKSGGPGSHREDVALQNKLFPKKSHWEMVPELCVSEHAGKSKIPRTSQGSEFSYASPPVLDQNN